MNFAIFPKASLLLCFLNRREKGTNKPESKGEGKEQV